MDTIWGERKPGQGTMVAELPEGWCVILDSGEYDWVKVPDHANHPDAGKRLRIEKFIAVKCVCGNNHNSRMSVLKGSTFAFIECVLSSKFYGVERRGA